MMIWHKIIKRCNCDEWEGTLPNIGDPILVSDKERVWPDTLLLDDEEGFMFKSLLGHPYKSLTLYWTKMPAPPTITFFQPKKRDIK